MRSLLLAPALVAAFVVSSITAHADELATFSFTANYAASSATPAGTVTGTVAIDTTIGEVVSENFMTSLVNSSYTQIPFEPSTQTGTWGVANLGEGWTSPASSNSSVFLNFYLPTPTLVNYSGGAICSAQNPCALQEGQYTETYNSLLDYDATSSPFLNGNFTEVSDVSGFSPTPEPSSLILFGTGTLALIGLFHRKIKC